MNERFDRMKFDQRNYFQMLVLDVVYPEIVPPLSSYVEEKQMKDQTKDFDPTFSSLLKKCSYFLRADISWTKEPLSLKQKFCWGILGTSCSKFNISTTGSLCSLQQFSNVIDKLCPVYSSYCSRQFNQHSTSPELPNHIENHPFDGVCR